MGKIGRNATCFCGSGMKFKKCCLNTQRETGQHQALTVAAPSLTSEIKALQQAAADHQPLFKVLGVFILFATQEGDAWVLEVSEMDAIRVAAEGSPLAVEIEENPQTMEINWSHRFRIKNRKLLLTSYADQAESSPPDCPIRRIQTAVNEIRRKISPELMQSIHLKDEDASA